MEGRLAKGLEAVTYAVDEESLDVAAGARLLAEQLAREVLSSTAFSHALCFIDEDATGSPSTPHILCIYESDATDPHAAYAALELGPPPRGLTELRRAGYVATGDLPAPKTGRETRGLLVGATECADPKRQAEFDEWYDHVHAADVLRHGAHHSAQRFRRTGGELTEFLTLYEAGGAQPSTFQSYFEWPQRDRRMLDACVVRHVWTFNRFVPRGAD